MKKTIFIFTLLFIGGSLLSQTPQFNNEISIDQTFTTNSEIFAFNSQSMNGVGIKGSVVLNSDTSLIRVILKDSLTDEYMIFESYPMLDTIWSFNFNEECEETCFMDGFTPTSLLIYIIDANLYLEKVIWNSTPVSNPISLQLSSKQNKVSEKLDKIRAYIDKEYLIWNADYSYFSDLFYFEKVVAGAINLEYPGAEFYEDGIFAIKRPSLESKDTYINYDYVESFDWRNRHGANDPESNYYDGDPNGGGWITDFSECQAGCFVDGTIDCSIPPGDCDAPNVWKSTALCWAFGPTAHIESLINLYLNYHADINLSEQNLASCLYSNPTTGGGSTWKSYPFYRDEGVVDEQTFPFKAEPILCNIPTPYTEHLFIDNYEYYNNVLTEQEVRQKVMEHGPIGISRYYLGPVNKGHAMQMVGWDVVEWEDLGTFIAGVPGNELHYAPWVGVTYWIYKDSNGSWNWHNGFFYAHHYNEQPPKKVYVVNTDYDGFVYSGLPIPTFTNNDIVVADNDLDGYCNWGIGPKPDGYPECPDEMDADDNNPGLGPMDEFGFCTIIDTYNSGFETSMDYWKQVDYDDCNWVKFYGTSWDWSDSGPNGTPDGSTNYLFMAEGHCYQVEHAYIESPPIDLAQHCRIEMNFAYHKNHYANGYDYSSLSVDISNDDGQTWQNDYWKIDGDKDDVWYYKTISLPSDITKLRFHGYFDDATFNLVPHHDMALDDITIGPGSTDDIIITGNETWDNQNYEICQDIIIEPNASLSFAKGTTVSFNEGNKIVVKQEGSLIVDSVFLTSSGDQLWYGIEVWGNPTAPQISSEQGLVILRNGAVIENSEQGIVACLLEENSTKDGWTPNPAYAGGMIQAKNSSLINNCTAIQFYDYPTESGSYLKDCLIEYNYDFDFCSVDLKMVRLRNMQGVEFEGCTFVKSETLVISPTGILAENSDFTVTEYCTNPEMSPCPEAYTQYSVFENLHYGIRSYNSSPNPVVEVDYAIFANNTQGIYIGGTTNSSVTNSEFTTRNNYFGGYGLYLDQSEGYTIEENVFEQGTSNYNSVGLIINHRGPLGDNVIYLNQFYEHLYAALAQGENRTYDEAGLQFRCNIFDPSCINNIIVVYPGQFNTPYAGISAYQGADIPQPDGPAGNLFSNSTQGGTSTDTDIYNESNSVTYYYHINEDYPLRPIYVTLGKVFPNEVFDAEWNEESCPPSEQGGGGQGDRGMLLSMISNASTQADSVETIIQLLEDDGSTENMKTEVELSTPPETYQVYNDLMSGSPYISDTVMEAAIEKEEVLPNVMIRDVMVANPHNAKNELLMEKIDERSNPMPAYMKAQILQGGSLVLFYEELQSKRSYYNRKRSEAFKGLVKSYLKDTVNQAASIDSLMELLENENSINAKYRLAFLGVEQGDWSMGQGVINGIPQQFNLEGDELERYEQMLSFYNLLSALSQQGKTIAEADSSQVETLFEIEAAQIGLPSVYARNVLLALEEITYQEPIFLPDFTKSAAMQLEYEILKQALDEHHYMAVFPNPAGDYLIIEHKLEMEAASVYAEIRNIKGEFVMDMALSGIQNQQTVDIKTLKAGIYIITLYVNNKELESVKFTKTN